MIPLIDISQSAGTIGRIEAASRDVGFMYLAGHGIAPAVLERARRAVIGYFSLPLDAKTRDCITRDNYRGYIPLGFFSPNNGSGGSDRYEGYKLHLEVDADDPLCTACSLYGPNRWPVLPAGFREALLAYWQACDGVAAILLRAYAEILGVSAERFLENFESPLTNMTLLHYPPPADETGIGIHAHKDTDALTIVAEDPVGGLQLRRRGDRDWFPAEPPAGTLVVNIGDMLELWSGGYFMSTPHRVVCPRGADRYSFPYFAVPRYDTVVAPLRSPQPGFDRGSVQAGEVSGEVWRTNWQDAKSGVSGFDLGTLES